MVHVQNTKYRAQVEASSNCLLLSSLCCLGPAEEAGIGDTPNLEDQAAGHVTQGQWSKPPLGLRAQEEGNGSTQRALP